jgi:hypothetical protein
MKWIKINKKDGTKKLPPDDGERVIIFSPCCKKGSPDRMRYIDPQFVRILTDATHWSYVEEPKEKTKKSI